MIESELKTDRIIYELPLNEAIRICLRLENLYQQFDSALTAGNKKYDIKSAMHALLKILEVTDRPDIKSKLSQTLTQYNTALTQLKSANEVNHQRLQTTLHNLDSLIHLLHTHHQRLGEPLRQNEFLYQIRSNLSYPGGMCDYRMPAYLLWQQQADHIKLQDLNNWMKSFDELRMITKTIMDLTRNSTPLQPTVADNGFYHQSCNPTIPFQMIRLALPISENLYPEFGAGKHRITIRFLKPSYYGDARPTQPQHSIHFELSCCKL